MLFAQTKKPTLAESIDSVQPLSGWTFTALAQEPEGGLTFVPANDPGFAYTGRLDFADPAAPVIIWQGSEINFRFSGTSLAVRFSDSDGRSSYNVIVDGAITPLRLERGAEYDYLLDQALPPGEHAVTLFKRTEAMSTKDRFKGIMISSGGKLLDPPATKPFKIEFYGDSITAGACDEVDGPDGYEDLFYHNNYTSYGAIAARALGAEYANVSWSGIGICMSWHPLLMPDVWANLYADAGSPRFDFKNRPADVVVVNLGQNDYGYSDNIKAPFPPKFAEEYARLIREIRAQYPQAWIVCATGGMSAIKSSRNLTKAWAAALKEFKDDPKVLSMTYKAFTYNHPRVDTHVKMAAELEAFIRKNVKLDGVTF
jgi:lysophospholipase L1-like esterase